MRLRVEGTIASAAWFSLMIPPPFSCVHRTHLEVLRHQILGSTTPNGGKLVFRRLDRFEDSTSLAFMNCSVAGLCPSDLVIINRAAHRDVERNDTNALFAGLKSLAG